MTNFKTKLATGAVTIALLASTFAPAAMGATVKIKGNGAFSHNGVHLTNRSSSRIRQVNKTAVVNLVGVFQNTGKNDANFNTGGDVDVNSGDATATVRNTTTTGGNSATTPDCGCPTPDDTLTISRNGAFSHNWIGVSNTSSSSTTQVNETLVVNGVVVGQNTGGNDANFNTGGGTVDVDSGNASATVTNTTTTGGNVLNP